MASSGSSSSNSNGDETLSAKSDVERLRKWSAAELALHYAAEARRTECDGGGGAEGFFVWLAGAERAVAVADRARMLTDMAADGVRCESVREHTAPPLYGGLWAHADNPRSVYRDADKLRLFPAWYDAKYREQLAPEDRHYVEARATVSVASTTSSSSSSSSPPTLASASSSSGASPLSPSRS